MSGAGQHVYLNGEFVPRAQAKLDVEERGVMFADGVYEVLRYYNGRPLAMDAHVQRLRRSMDAIELHAPDLLGHVARTSDELMQRNGHADGIAYWQVSRGVAPRTKRSVTNVPPTVVLMSYPAAPLDQVASPSPTTAITLPDIRWARCDIKSLMLLPSVTAQLEADRVGADTAILHRDGVVTEATSANILAVRGDELWTHPADQWILDGISRRIVLQLVREAGIAVREEPFTVEQMLAADEVLICGTTRHVGPVVRIEDRVIGDGGVGPVCTRLHKLFLEHARRECGLPA